MPLTMRPTGLLSPIDEDRGDFTNYSRAWAIGRIYEERGGPEHLRWFWSLYGMFGKPAEIRSDGRPTIEDAKAQFETAWRQSLAWVKLDER